MVCTPDCSTDVVLLDFFELFKDVHGKIEQIVRARGFPPQRPVSGSMHRRPSQVVSPLRGIAGGKVEMPWSAPRLCPRGEDYRGPTWPGGETDM